MMAAPCWRRFRDLPAQAEACRIGPSSSPEPHREAIRAQEIWRSIRIGQGLCSSSPTEPPAAGIREAVAELRQALASITFVLPATSRTYSDLSSSTVRAKSSMQPDAGPQQPVLTCSAVRGGN
jgi:hypothetical protein